MVPAFIVVGLGANATMALNLVLLLQTFGVPIPVLPDAG
jgi:hypothetical protein